MKRVAVSMRVTQAENYDEPRDTISRDWSTFLHGLGLLPVFLPNHLAAARDIINEISPSLLILSGGDDIGTDAARDQTERQLIEDAGHSGLPLLGVCRGMQLVNRAGGGADIRVEDHVAKPHGITVENAMRDVYGTSTTVNSFHSIGIEEAGLAPDLLAWAHDDAGHVEGFSDSTGRTVGIMWHPERAGAPDADRALLLRMIDNRGLK